MNRNILLAWVGPIAFLACGGISSIGGGTGGSGGTGGANDAGACVCTGPRPLSPNFVCPDGSLGGPVCATNSDNTCSWKIRSCPDAGADAGACVCSGPRPLSPNFECPDGSLGGPVCATNPDNTCSWKIRSCPTDAGPNACQPSQCSDSTQCPTGSFCSEVQTGGLCISKRCCPALGCNPLCPNGVLKDANGCDTCQCAPTGSQCTTAADCPQPGGLCSGIICVSGTCKLIDVCTTSDAGINPCSGKPCGATCRTGLRVNAEACTADGRCDEANYATCTCTQCQTCTVSGCASP